MDTDYWLQRWREGRTGWHHPEVMPLLEKNWPALDVSRGTRVLVPLCGKSLDMLWLASQGLRVLGVELSALAAESFLAENHLRAHACAGSNSTRYLITDVPEDGDIEIIQGDLFEIDQVTLASCNAFYDRAALIALPAPMRERMAHEVYAKLSVGSRGLLITLDYPSQEMDGPPFSVDAAEVHRLFEPHWQVERLELRDILASQPHFMEQGVTAMHTSVYGLTKRRA